MDKSCTEKSTVYTDTGSSLSEVSCIESSGGVSPVNVGGLPYLFTILLLSSVTDTFFLWYFFAAPSFKSATCGLGLLMMF